MSLESIAQEYAKGARGVRKLGNNTYLLKDGENYSMRYHQTDVARYTPEYIELTTGGWHTFTTKERLNWALSQVGLHGHTRVYSHNRQWFVGDNPFFDGIRLDYSGNVLNASDAPEDKRAKTEKQIDSYIRGLGARIDKMDLPEPSSGDCWGCVMRDKDGKTVMGNSHLETHLEEKYYMVSLILNALKARGYRSPAIFLSDGAKYSPETMKAHKSTILRAARWYFRQMLLNTPEAQNT